jgi:hypothetical protein
MSSQGAWALGLWSQCGCVDFRGWLGRVDVAEASAPSGQAGWCCDATHTHTHTHIGAPIGGARAYMVLACTLHVGAQRLAHRCCTHQSTPVMPRVLGRERGQQLPGSCQARECRDTHTQRAEADHVHAFSHPQAKGRWFTSSMVQVHTSCCLYVFPLVFIHKSVLGSSGSHDTQIPNSCCIHLPGQRRSAAGIALLCGKACHKRNPAAASARALGLPLPCTPAGAHGTAGAHPPLGAALPHQWGAAWRGSLQLAASATHSVASAGSPHTFMFHHCHQDDVTEPLPPTRPRTFSRAHVLLH